MKLFCDPHFARLLELHHLDDFDALWNLGDQVVQDPNVRRGGWNGVCHLRLSDVEGTTHTYLLKRQQNHLTHCGFLLQKRPTFYSEFRSILLCWEHSVPCLDATYYGERKHPSTGLFGRDYQAILITHAPENYSLFSEISSRWDTFSETDRRRYLQEIAGLFAGLHKNRLSGNSLSTNHLFINLDANPPVKLIDTEKIGFHLCRTRKYLTELAIFLRRTGVFSADEVEFFLNYYSQHHPLGLPLEKLIISLSTFNAPQKSGKGPKFFR